VDRLGLHAFMTNADYHKSGGISRSALMEFKKSPYHYWSRYISPNKREFEATPAMVLGEMVHTAVLEPQEFDKRYVKSFVGDRRTHAGKDAYLAFIGALHGRMVVKDEHYELALEISEQVHQDKFISPLLKKCEMEQSIFWKHEGTGLVCKARPDAWSNGMVIDLKTAANADYRHTQSASVDHGYFLQAGMIKLALASIGVELSHYIICAVEKTYPFAVANYILDESAVDFGVRQFNELIEQYDQCLQNDKWPGYEAKQLYVPDWAERQQLTDLEFDE